MATYLQVPSIAADFVEKALRSHLAFLGSVSTAKDRAAVTALVAFLRSRFGAELRQVTLRGGGQRAGRRPLTPKTWDAVAAWIAGPKDGGDHLVIAAGDARDAVPALIVRVERKTWFAEVNLPADADPATCDDVFACVVGCSWLWGAQGYGTHLSASEEEYLGHLGPLDPAKLRCALQLTSSHIEEGLTHEGSLLGDHAGSSWEPGIPDVGWRTIVGPSFFSRLAGQREDGVHVHRTAAWWSVTAGPAPVWGTPADDVAPYVAAAAFLAPIRIDRSIALLRFFRGIDERARYPFARQKLKRFNAWWSRFESSQAPAPKAPAQKASSTKATPKKAPATKVTAKKAAPKKAAPKKKAPAKKTTPKKAPATKTTAKKAAPKKTRT